MILRSRNAGENPCESGATSIELRVTNLTADSSKIKHASDSVATALHAKIGDQLRYEVTVNNYARTSLKGIQVVDELPRGVSVVSDAAVRTVQVQFAPIGPDNFSFFTVTVRVDSQRGGPIQNRACFAASHGHGCDVAFIQVDDA
jgi:uncharacterized repeat protein (TIGR01451 family)